MTIAATGSRPRLRRLVPVVAAGVLAIGLGACGDSDGGTPSADPPKATTAELGPAEAVAAAADTSKKQSSAQFNMDMKMVVAGSTVEMTGEGEMDSAKQAVSMKMGTKALSSTAIETSVIVIKDTVYMQVPGKKQWVKLDAAKAKNLGYDRGSGDPSQQLGLLKQVSDDVKEAGRETVNGVETTKYEGTIDLAKAAEAQGETDAAVREQYEEMGMKTMPFELYIDDDGLPSRMVIKSSGELTQGGQSGEVKLDMTVNYTEWGQPVSIKAPKKTISAKEAGLPGLSG